ncbi:MAG TPA: neuraminidase-like domain-containing protein [Blastocatellia bacterium]|nr:neuraminidase-like domain-containing protein [Blastocatellia bacterium]
MAKLSEMTGWNLDDLTFLDGPTGLALSPPATRTNPKLAYTDERALTRLSDCFAMMRRLGVSARQCRSWAAANPTVADASAAKQAAKARFSDQEWEEVDQPVRERLSEKLRAALVSYLIAHPGTNQTWKDSNGLYDYFLIDPEMSPCMMTSRIKQAISSVQLFVQRCLMNLEPGVKAGAEIDSRWGDWKWMKSYRVWEANRKVFLYPENWVEPELRDDKSPFFKDLENELLQNDITSDTAETAFLHYLDKLDEVARLEIVGMYHQLETDALKNPVLDVWHVFGRTYGTPHIYYYRQWVDASYWTAWEKVDVDIEGDHLIPVVWNRRLFLIWPVFTKETNPAPVIVPEPNHAIADPISFWKIKLGWSQLKNSKWASKKISKDALRAILSPLPEFFFRVPTSDHELVIDCYTTSLPTLVEGDGDSDRFDSKPTFVWFAGRFRFDECNSDPEILGAPTVTSLILPLATKVENMALAEQPLDTFGTSQGRVVFLTSAGSGLTGELYVPDELGINKQVLLNTPGTFRLLLPHEAFPYKSQDPFIFYDSMRTYFVIPKRNQSLTTGLGNPNKVNPKTLDNFGQQYFASFQAPSTFATFSAAHALLNSSTSSSDTQSASIRNVSSRTTVVERAPMSTAALNFSEGISNTGAGSTSVSIRDILNGGPNVSIVPGNQINTKYRFNVFYHPYVCFFIKELSRKRLDGLLARENQTSPPELFNFNSYLTLDSQPVQRQFILDPLAQENVDFKFDGAYAQYNWELFFHAPFEIAVRLTKNQRFEEAQKWFHYIFDPTSASDIAGSAGDPKTRRYWQTKAFFERLAADYEKQRIEKLLNPPDATSNSDLIGQTRQWLANPFNPHAIARLRGVAYQKTVVMKYLDNLIEWGDQLFRRDTIESINEATQLYIMAAEILGPRPQEIHPRGEPAPQTYERLAARLDAVSHALENLSPAPGGANISSGATPPMTLQVFCIPKNDKLLAYWDTVADRLFKIRHCQNIEGVVRQLALFEPPIDPALLVKAAAAGIDISSALNDINAALPHYRFNVMSQKAGELCAELKALGAALLSALEKRDAEQLALLRSEQEMKVLDAVRVVRERQIEEATEALEALKLSRDLATIRQDHYSSLLSGISPSLSLRVGTGPVGIGVSISLAPMNELEVASLAMTALGLLIQSGTVDAEAIASILHLIPEVKIGTPTTVGATYGGSNVAPSAQAFGQSLATVASMLYTAAGAAATLGGYKRRAEEWDLQKTLAGKEIEQIDRQIAAAEIRLAIAEQELKNHLLQIENAKASDEFMHSKFTNRELYEWMAGEISGIYFQSYQLAYDVAKRSERAFRFELGLEDSSFIQFGYWDSLKKGLLAGERLSHDLKRMEITYLDQNKREYELTKHISIALLDPVALIKLKETGQCFVSLEEPLFDMDYSGHYMRRIKSVALTIPCVTGPYTSVNCTLTLLKNSVRAKTGLSPEYNRDEGDSTNPDLRFRDSVGAIQSIATSSAQNDSGLFELNFRDERYLPFEGAGAISTWRIELPKETNRFDFNTISDVIIHMKYTARDGGEALKKVALESVNQKASEAGARARLFSARHEFPSEWNRFLHPGESDPPMLRLNLTADKFPFLPPDKTIQIDSLELFLGLKGLAVDFSGPLVVKVEPAGSAGAFLRLTSLPAIVGVLHGSFEPNQKAPIDLVVTVGEDASGKTTIPAELQPPTGTQRLNADAIEDMGVVCHFSVV